ncbi:GIY-YIG nuclease family protein [Clostridium botulinum]|uniref:GIY-YIG nuclease family protein n=1 Tax=Clostridium botulinum TaxID=1491 RepID=UPI00174C4F95|nr:GIY-YIG nuclease family protein [Clostridium botulinum]MBD5589140.1 GIY-YIG nuclease family protein [Clostridium botulinum]
MRGIYKIQNKTNGKIYIGESLDIRRRWEEHKELLNNNEHHSWKLQEDWNTYGEDDFKFKILNVLDDCINSYIDKYICILYEAKYIKEYNTIEDGYNIEKTILEVVNGDKIVTNEKRDKGILKKYFKQIENNNIKLEGGIIYLNCYSISDIKKSCNTTNRMIKKLLHKNNYVIINKDNYILNEDIFNKEDIIANDKFSKIKFNKKLYLDLVAIVTKLIQEDTKEENVIKTKNIKTTKKIEVTKEIRIEKEKEREIIFNKENCTMREFINSYILNVKYIDVFKFLRDNNILKYTYIEEEKYNVPTDNFTDCFNVVKSTCNNKEYFKIIINQKGKRMLEDILIKNNIISK